MSNLVTVTLKAGMNIAAYTGLEAIHNQSRVIDVAKRANWIEVLTQDFGVARVGDPAEFVIRRAPMKGHSFANHALTAPIREFLAEYKTIPRFVAAHLVKTARRRPVSMVMSPDARRPVQPARVKPEPTHTPTTSSAATGQGSRPISGGNQSKSYKEMVAQASKNSFPDNRARSPPKHHMPAHNGNQTLSQYHIPKKRPVPTAGAPPQQPNPKQPRVEHQNLGEQRRHGKKVVLNPARNVNRDRQAGGGGNGNANNGGPAPDAYDDDDLDSQVGDLPAMGITFESVRKKFNAKVAGYKDSELTMTKTELETFKKENPEYRKYFWAFPKCMFMMEELLLGSH